MLTLMQRVEVTVKHIILAGCFVAATIAASDYVMISYIKDLKSEMTDIKEQVAEVKKDVREVQEAVFYRVAPVKLSDSDRDCLARNIFFEAGVESHAGKIAVAQVTLNRARSKRWGNTVCDAVYAPAQFSWTLYKKKRNSQPKGRLWEDSLKAAADFQQGIRVKGLNKSKFYHTTYIRRPHWARADQVVTKIGQHIFYVDA